MSKLGKFVSALAIAGAISLPLAVAGSAQERVVWNMQSGYSPKLSVIGETAKYFTDTVQRLSGGTLVLRYLDPGALVSPPEMHDAVGAGRIEAGYTWSGYIAGKIPAINIFNSVPFGPTPEVYMAWMLNGGGKELVNELYKPFNLHSLPCGLLPPEASGWFRKPVEKVEQLRGMKIRFVGLGADAIRKLGASPTLIPVGEIFLNLERGVIDATEFSLPSIDKDLGFYKVAKHYYFPGWHQPSTILEVIVNLDRWNKLSDTHRAILEVACSDSMRWGLVRAISEQPKALEYFKAQGVIFHRWSPELLAAFRKASNEVMEEHAAKDANFKRAWDSLRKFQADAKIWTELSNIPD